MSGEPPFKAGDLVELLNSHSANGLVQARITHRRWDEVEDTWRFDVRISGHATDTMDIASDVLRKVTP